MSYGTIGRASAHLNKYRQLGAHQPFVVARPKSSELGKDRKQSYRQQ